MPYILDPRLPATSFSPPTDVYGKARLQSKLLHVQMPDCMSSLTSPLAEPKNSPFDFSEGPPSKEVYYAKKFPGAEQRESFSKRLNDEGAPLGLAPLVFSGSGKVGATWDAERLLSKAWDVEESSSDKRGVQDQLALKLYEAFHVHSRDISDHAVLADLSVEVGVFTSRNAAIEWLQGDDHAYEVKHKLRQAEMNGVQSVPFYIVNDGADHLSQTGNKESFMRMFKMATANVH